MRRAVLVLVLWFSPLAHADIDPVAATVQLRARFETEWQVLIDAPKSSGWRIQYRSNTLSGDLALHLSGWRYFFDQGKLRCRIQTDEFMICGHGEAVAPRWTATERSSALTVGMLRQLRRELWGTPLPMTIDGTGNGHATIETIVSTSYAPSRTSRRYRAEVTFTAKGFTLGNPQLVEEYEETCVGISGCHSTHWTCSRKR